MDIRIVMFALYLLMMLGIGLFYYKRNENISDYILGGRQLNVWVTAMSAQASDMSSWLLMGLPGLAYCFRLAAAGPVYTYDALCEAIWTGIGLLIGTYLNWLFVAKRLRRYTQVAGDSLTISEYFHNRFHDRTGLLKLISSVVIIVAFTLYTSAQFSAGAKLFEAVFGLEYRVALLIGALVIVSYTFLGGFLAVCWTDLIQGLLMFGALVIVPFSMLNTMGCWGGFQEQLAAMAAAEFGNAAASGSASATMIASSLAWGLGYCGMPHILVRFMGIRSSREIRPARIIAMVWVVISMICAILVGFVGTAYIGDFFTASEAESIFIMAVEKLFHPAVQGILLTAILAAIMSTADSQLLVASSAFAEDIYGVFDKRQADHDALQKRKLWIGRLTVAVISLVAIVLAFDRNSSVFRLVQNAWAILGAAFGPVVLLSLYWKRMTARGALAGMAGGALVTILWKSLSGFGGLFAVYELLPGFIVGLMAIVVFSLMDKAPSREIEEEFERSLSADI